MEFEIIGAVSSIETIAAGRHIRDLDWLQRAHREIKIKRRLS